MRSGYWGVTRDGGEKGGIKPVLIEQPRVHQPARSKIRHGTTPKKGANGDKKKTAKSRTAVNLNNNARKPEGRTKCLLTEAPEFMRARRESKFSEEREETEALFVRRSLSKISNKEKRW